MLNPNTVAGAALIAALAVLGSAPVSHAVDVPVHGVHEVTLAASGGPYASPYSEVTCYAQWTGPSGTLTANGPATEDLPCFWDGGSTWVSRMAPTEPGTWTLTRVSSNDPGLACAGATDCQKHSAPGSEVSFGATLPTAQQIDSNETLRHGFVRVSADRPQRFEHADGAPFFMVGDTLWGQLCALGDHFQNGDFQQVVDAHAAQGYTIANLCHLAVHLDSFPNEGGSAFNGSHSSGNFDLNPSFFEWIDQRVDYMTRKGVRPLIVYGAPDGGLTNDVGWNARLAEYLVGRFAAYDVIWFGVKEFDEWSGSAAAIDAFGNQVQAHDPYDHPTSTHSTTSTTALAGRAWLDFHSIQGRASLDSLYAQGKPVLSAESYYEDVCDGGAEWNYSDHEEFLDAIWKNVAMSGGFMGGHFIPCNDPSQYLARFPSTSNLYQSRLREFFQEHTDFQDLAPHDELRVSGTAEVLAGETGPGGGISGDEYVAYLGNPSAPDVTLDLSHRSGILAVEWFDPAGGQFQAAGTVNGGANRPFTRPSQISGVAVLHLSATVLQDDTPPSVPSGLGASAQGASSIALSWSPSSDGDSGIAYYRVFRGGSFLEQASSTSYTDTGLSAETTYTYHVTAVNGAGLESGPSGTASATTEAAGSGPLVSNLNVSSGSTYVVAEGLVNGSTVYVDRTYTYSAVPSILIGATYIRTANEDKSTDGGADLLSFDLGQAATVYVAHDDRFAVKPSWLQDFADSGDGVTTDVPLSLFRRDYPQGTVVLGGNRPAAEPEDNSMYTVIVVTDGGSGAAPPAPVLLGPS